MLFPRGRSQHLLCPHPLLEEVNSVDIWRGLLQRDGDHAAVNSASSLLAPLRRQD